MAENNAKYTIDDVCSWHEAKAERGELSNNTARLRCTALRMLVTPLAPEEPRDAAWVRDHLDDLAKRWATLNPKYQADTSVTYQSRAKSALDDHARWQNDPTGFRFAEQRPRTPRPPKVQEQTPKMTPVAGVPDAEWEAIKAGTITNTFRMGPGREVRFTIPDDITIAEVRRLAAHFATYSPDWGNGDGGAPPSTAMVPSE